MRYHSDVQATMIAHRSPRGKRPPETEISSIIEKILSFRYLYHCFHAQYFTVKAKALMQRWVF
ncbi:hypothetical protein [Psychrobacillus antarcticus]|uniref:hypothetical protein n=1 Tax=Psychrobacillus antarcticus TaxID=2879115 RepID=UPI002407D73F|nr:hypothetical protein [Psychrobacillus antarcticus]